MKISMKGDYGIRALTELAHHYGQGPTQSAEIAARQHIPEPYLDQLLTTLRKAGFIRSTRGPQGGHELARPADSIQLSEVVVALEGTIAPISCLDESGNCNRLPGCVQRDVWEQVKESTERVLSATTIADLAERQRQQEGVAMYHI
jgi:Rrf2 family protein